MLFDRVVARIASDLGNSDGTVRAEALERLSRLTPPHTFELVEPCVVDNDPEVRINAAIALESSRDPRAVPALLQLLQADGSDVVREAAARSTAPFRTNAVLLALLQVVAARPRSNLLRAQIIRRLGTYVDGRVFACVANSLKDEDWLVRDEAIDAARFLLHAFGLGTEAEELKHQIRAWKEGVDDSRSAEEVSHDIATVARNALARASMPLYEREVFQRYLVNEDEGERVYAVDVLCELCPEYAVDLLVPLTADSSASVRRATATALGEQRRPDSVPALIRMARFDSDGRVRHFALRALDNYREPSVQGFLVEILRNPTLDLSPGAASRQLWKYDHPDVVSALENATRFLVSQAEREEAEKSLCFLRQLPSEPTSSL